jgi:hypothetical protein
MSRSNRSAVRTALVAGGQAPRCPACQQWLDFGTDRDGRAVQQCECGYRSFVPLRSGSGPPLGAAAAKPPETPPE